MLKINNDTFIKDLHLLCQLYKSNDLNQLNKNGKFEFEFYYSLDTHLDLPDVLIDIIEKYVNDVTAFTYELKYLSGKREKGVNKNLRLRIDSIYDGKDNTDINTIYINILLYENIVLIQLMSIINSKYSKTNLGKHLQKICNKYKFMNISGNIMISCTDTVIRHIDYTHKVSTPQTDIFRTIIFTI